MDPIEQHPAYIRAKENLIEQGLKYGWLTHTVDTTSIYAQFIPAGKKHNVSPCPCYLGRWRLGGFGAVKCKVSKDPLPGAYFDLICEKNHETCPHRKKGERHDG